MSIEHMEGFISACYIWALVAIVVAVYLFLDYRHTKKREKNGK
jgi:hypothetical protein